MRRSSIKDWVDATILKWKRLGRVTKCYSKTKLRPKIVLKHWNIYQTIWWPIFHMIDLDLTEINMWLLIISEAIHDKWKLAGLNFLTLNEPVYEEWTNNWIFISFEVLA
jgi:hypothetical protein